MRLAAALLFFQFGLDPIRHHELRERALRSQIQTAERERAIQERNQRAIVEAKFNKLAAAVESFAKEYNKTKGQAWPKKQADDLRVAMEDLQNVEPTLRAKCQNKCLR